MKWTTANVINSSYNENHEIYVGTHTGSFKKLMPANVDNPFAQQNLQDLHNLAQNSHISALAFGNLEESEIIIGRMRPMVQLYSLRNEKFAYTLASYGAAVVGVARYGDQLIAGVQNGLVKCVQVEEGGTETLERFQLITGDDMSHLRQCQTHRNLIATGGKGRQNNLKVFDIEAGGKQVFTTKNLANDYLQLEVPVWDSDFGFADIPNILASCSRHGYVRVYDTRKQRRPVQSFATEDQMSFVTLMVRGNYIYTGTTIGALKAFDIRRMKNFVHTYKGFTGGISDLHLDTTGKYLASASLDRYVRLHHTDSCSLLYQCYVKSKPMRILLRESMENTNTKRINESSREEELAGKVQKKRKENYFSEDEEYNEIFNNMQTVCENNEHDVDGADLSEQIVNTGKATTGSKRKIDKKR